jgi:hypothetical protein
LSGHQSCEASSSPAACCRGDGRADRVQDEAPDHQSLGSAACPSRTMRLS